MSKKKGVTKSHSVNDVPIGLRPNNLLEAMEEGHFEELLGRLATPSYTRKSEGCLTTTNIDEEQESKLRWMETNLRQNDEEEQRRRQTERNRDSGSSRADTRNPPSTSPPASPSKGHRSGDKGSYSFAPKEVDYIDSSTVEEDPLVLGPGGDGPGGDIEMDDLSGRSPITYTQGNIEQTVQEWSDETIPQEPFMGRSHLEDAKEVENEGQELMNELVEDEEDYQFRTLRPRDLGELAEMFDADEPTENPPVEIQYPRVENRMLNTGKPGEMGSLGSSDCTSDTMSDGSVGTTENLTEDHCETAPNPFEYSMIPRFPCYPPFDVQKGTLSPSDRFDTGSKFAQSKKRVEKKKQKASKGLYTVGQSGSGIEGVSVDTLTVDELAASIEGDEAKRERRRRQNNTKKEKAAATIGNQNGKAPAAAQGNKSQNPTGASASMNKDNNKKSPNKKNKKGGNAAGSNSSSPTPEAASAPEAAPPAAPDAAPAPEAAPPTAPGKNIAGRNSTEDAEEEYMSADEGVANMNTVSSTPSDVMIDGANYRADTDDLSNLDNHVNNETEFTEVVSKKKKAATTQPLRTGFRSSGKVERRGPPQPQQPRRNSMEDSRLTKQARHFPQPQNISLGDYLTEKKHETHTKAKAVPFKESKKKHERLESTADSEYMDANEEMVLPTANTNEVSIPERGFSYADAAKKSAEPSRENSPACVNQSSGTPGVTPSPPPTLPGESLGSASTSSKATSKSPDAPTSSTAPVVMPENAGENGEATDLCFFYNEAVGSNDSGEQSASSSAASDGTFVLKLPGRTVQFARGLAAPSNAEPIDENHRALRDTMTRRWNTFMNVGPAPIFYKPPQNV